MANLDIITHLKNQAKQGLSSLTRSIDEVEGASEKASKGFGGIEVSWKNLVGASVAVIGAIYTIKKGLDFTEGAESIALTTTKFARLTEIMGGHVAVLERLKAATKGQVTEAVAMEQANNLIGMGLANNSAELEKHFQIVTTLKKPNEEFGAALENWTALLANQSTPRLDSFYISSDKVKTKIKELREEFPNMTREAAFLTATMEEAEVSMDLMGDQAANMSTVIKTQLLDAWNKLKVAIVDENAPALKELAGETIPALIVAFEDLGPAIVGSIGVVGEVLGETIAGFAMYANLIQIAQIDLAAAAELAFLAAKGDFGTEGLKRANIVVKLTADSLKFLESGMADTGQEAINMAIDLANVERSAEAVEGRYDAMTEEFGDFYDITISVEEALENLIEDLETVEEETDDFTDSMHNSRRAAREYVDSLIAVHDAVKDTIGLNEWMVEAAIRQEERRADRRRENAYAERDLAKENAVIRIGLAEEVATVEEDALKRLKDAYGDLAAGILEIRDQSKGYFAEILQGTDVSSRFLDTLLAEAAAAGLSKEALKKLAAAYSDVDDSIVDAAWDTANMVQQQELLKQALLSGVITTDEFIAAMANLAPRTIDERGVISGGIETAGEALGLSIDALEDFMARLADLPAKYQAPLAVLLGQIQEDLGIVTTGIGFMGETLAEIPEEIALSFISNALEASEEVSSYISFLDQIPEEIRTTINLDYVTTRSGIRGLPEFQHGGSVGPRGGFVHPNEYVFSAPAVRAIGAGNLETMHSTGSIGGGDFYFTSSITVHAQGASSGAVDKIRKVVKQELRRAGHDAEARYKRGTA